VSVNRGIVARLRVAFARPAGVRVCTHMGMARRATGVLLLVLLVLDLLDISDGQVRLSG